MSSDHRDLPLVSVIVPAYKHEKFVAAALQSVYDQDYPNIELIVIDDASPDGTAREVASWAANPDVQRRFHRFVFLANHTNAGAHANINRGCEMAQGTYLAVLNSDDRFHSQRLSRMIPALTGAKGSLAFSRVAPIGEDGELVSPAALPRPLNGVFALADAAVANMSSLAEGFLAANIGISTGNFIFSRKLFDKVGPFADLKYVHDWDFALRSTLLAEPVYVSEDLYEYRLHGSNSFSGLADVALFETRVVMSRFDAARRSLGVKH